MYKTCNISLLHTLCIHIGSAYNNVLCMLYKGFLFTIFFCIVYKPSSEAELATAAGFEEQVAIDAVPTVYLGQEILTKHSTLQTNGEYVCNMHTPIHASCLHQPQRPYASQLYTIYKACICLMQPHSHTYM